VWKLHDRKTDQSTDFPTEADAKAELEKHAAPVDASIGLADLKLEGSQPVRDLWRQKDLGPTSDKVSTSVPYHGAVMLKLGKPKDDQ